jgi:hypothetical protein
MGILNMMIVVPMLVQTLTFGWIYKHWLDGKGSNAMILAGVLLGIGAIAMLWVNPRDADGAGPEDADADHRHQREVLVADVGEPDQGRRRPGRARSTRSAR